MPVEKAKETSETESLHKICAQMIGAMTDAVILIEPQGTITRTNQATLSLLAFDEDEIIGHPIHKILSVSKDRQAPREEGGVQVDIVNDVLASIEAYLFPKHGKAIPISMRSSSVRDDDGEVTGIVLVARDLRPTMKLLAEAAMGEAERRKREELQHAYDELKQLQEQLIQSEKMASLGQMAAGVAHEINNPLSGIMVYLHMIMDDIRKGQLDRDQALKFLGESQDELKRCSRIIKSLLDFSRQSHPRLTPVEIGSVLEETFEILAHKAKLQDVEVAWHIEAGLPPVQADPDQMKQVFLNLMLNAIQAMPRGGRLSIRAARSANSVRVDIADTGCGIAAQNISKLFTPFFTTKEKGEGVGLGLAMAYGIVKHHGGDILVSSSPGEGTTFSVVLGCSGESPGAGAGGAG